MRTRNIIVGRKEGLNVYYSGRDTTASKLLDGAKQIFNNHFIDVKSMLLAGIMVVVLGATGVGTAVKFIPRPVVVGFTNGIAIIIASTQIKDFFGLKTGAVHGEFLGRIETLIRSFGTISGLETGMGLLGLTIILLCSRHLQKVPGYVVALF